MMFLTLKFSRGAVSGSSPLSSWRTICCRIRSSSCQCCRLPPPRLSGRDGETREKMVICYKRQDFGETAARADALTGHLQTVLENGEEVWVRVRVVQLLLDQLEHGTGTLSVYMCLWGSETDVHSGGFNARLLTAASRLTVNVWITDDHSPDQSVWLAPSRPRSAPSQRSPNA